MKSENRYLMGMLWKFGTIKSGTTSHLVFQSYDKFDQMEYIRKRLAPDKEVKISTRKDPRTGLERTMYRLNFTNKEWADKKKKYDGINAKIVMDEDFVRGFIEMKGSMRDVGCNKGLCVSLSSLDESDEISKILSKSCDTTNINGHVKKNGSVDLKYGKTDTWKIINTFIQKNPKYWGEIAKKMNPDD